MRYLSQRRGPTAQAAAGFSLLESLVALLVLAGVMIGILSLFESSDKLSRTQSYIAEMQTSQRLAQADLVEMIRMSGIGGLPEGIPSAAAAGNSQGVFPSGLALAVRKNVPAESRIGNASSPKILTGTDVLILRGVFSTPVYYLEPQQPLALNPGTGRADRHVIELKRAVDIGVEQDLEPLRQALRAALNAGSPRPEAVIVRDRFNPGAYAVFQLDPATTVPGNTGDATLTIGLTLASGTAYAEPYGRFARGTTLLQGAGGETLELPSGTVVTLPRQVGTLGLLEEYRVYVRQDFAVADDNTTRLKPVLARARFYPGTDDLHPEGSLDLADHTIDLQVALGVDQVVPGSVPPHGDGRIAEDGTSADEVLFNAADDDDGLTNIGFSPWAAPGAQVAFLRLHTIVQAARPDRDFPGLGLGQIEDQDRSASVFSLGDYRKFRKQHLATTIELRNMP